MVLSIDDELPWDPLWAYVLGEGDDQYVQPSSTKKRTTSQNSKEGGFLSYIHDIIPEPESRDDGWRPNSSGGNQEVKRSDSSTKRGSFGSSQSKRGSFGSNQSKKGSFGSKDEPTAKTRGFWGRGKREVSTEATESRESWDWRLDLDNSEDGEESKADVPQKKAVASRSASFSKSKDIPDKVKKKEEPTMSPTLSAFSCDPWDWELDVAPDPVLDAKDSKAAPVKKEPAKELSRKDRQKMKSEAKAHKKAEKMKNAPKAKKEVASSNESWDWQLGPVIDSTNDNSKTGRRGLWRSNKEKPTTEPWDWSLSNQDAKKAPRKVRFARGQKKDEELDWADPDEVAAKIQLSQIALLDWVGLNQSTSSSDVDDDDETLPDRMSTTRAKPVESTLYPVSSRKVERKSVDKFSKPGGSVFGSLFNNWDDLSYEDESTLNSTSTQDSSAVSTEDFSEDGTKTTQQSDISSVLAMEPAMGELNEVRLAYQPNETDKNNTNLLPIITEDASVEETHFYSDERSGSGSDITQKLRGTGSPDKPSPANSFGNTVPNTVRRQRIGSFNSILEGVESATSKPEPDESSKIGASSSRDIDEVSRQLPRSRGRGIGVCRMANSLSEDQLNWTKQTGVPFHELSQHELSQIFPKVRSIPDGQNARSAIQANPNERNQRGSAARVRTSFDSSAAQSLFEYEYETGVHMFVSFDSPGVGFDGLTVKTAPTPKQLQHASVRKRAIPDVLLQVEASTVSRTDCYIRQGVWLRQPEPPMPNTPGVDVVGRLCRLDTEAQKKYGLSIGDRVMSLVKWGGNSRYLSINPSTVVKVPDSVDPAAAVCLVETYLSAFQILHFKQGSKERYQTTSLKGKTVLVLGHAISNMGRAISQLASVAGAMQVFAMAKSSHFEQLYELGISPLHQDSSDCWKDLTGIIDLIISIDVEIVEQHRKLLSGKGRIISLVNGPDETDVDNGRKARLACRRQERRLQRKLTFFNIYDEWETNMDRCKLDMEYLIQLLDENKVEPNILDRVALHKVARAQSIVESKRLSGFIVCEPWLVAKSRAIRL